MRRSRCCRSGSSSTIRARSGQAGRSCSSARPCPPTTAWRSTRRSPERAVRELTDRLREALRQQMIEADDRQTLRLMRVAETLWRGQAPGSAAEETARVAAIQQVARVHRELQQRAPDQLAILATSCRGVQQRPRARGRIQPRVGGSYPAGRRLPLGRAGGTLTPAWPAARVRRDPAARGPVLADGHRGPGARAARGRGGDVQDHGRDVSSTRRAGSSRAGSSSSWPGAGRSPRSLVALLPTGFFALGWQEHLSRVARETRAFVRFLSGRDLYQRLVERRRALVAEITALVSLVETPGVTRETPRS